MSVQTGAALRTPVRRITVALLCGVLLFVMSAVHRPDAAQAHTGWAACKGTANGHLCFRGVIHQGVESTDMLYHKISGGTITARFYLHDLWTGTKYWDAGWFQISAGQARTYVFPGHSIWWVDVRECMAVQGQSDVCVL